MLDIDRPSEDEDTDEYDVPLMPVQVPEKPTPGPSNTVKPERTQTEKATDDDDSKPMLLPRVLGTAVKIEFPANNEKPKPKKRIIKTVEYKLKRKYTKNRNFSCVGCADKFESQKELNKHF